MWFEYILKPFIFVYRLKLTKEVSLTYYLLLLFSQKKTPFNDCLDN